MRIEEITTTNEYVITEYGRVVKGVNTTCDVGVDEIKTQAKKMGFDVTRDGVPPKLRTDGKKHD